MRIGLYNLEPKYKNLALEKIRLYHTGLGDSVEDYFALSQYDKVYVSSIFDFTRRGQVPIGAVCGGSGFDLTTQLPPEIDTINPHLNFGFTTRGCIRDCPFCIVRRKEGGIRIEGDLMDLWDGQSKDITLYDNNILALPEHFALVCKQSQENHIRLDFNQGLDHRLLNPEIVRILKETSHKEYRFAFDSPAYVNSVDRAITLLQDGGIQRSLWYVLVGFNTSFDEDLSRVNFLRDRGQQAYIQRYTHRANEYRYIALSQWVNQHHIFYGMTWEQFLDTEHSRKRQYNKLVRIS